VIGSPEAPKGRLGGMDYQNLRDIQSETGMRNASPVTETNRNEPASCLSR
jgi:hypothetical protein